MSELKKKAIKAASTFMKHRGYEVVDESWQNDEGGAIDVVARDEETVVFCDVYARKGTEKGMPDDGGEGSRERREINAAKWLAENATDNDCNGLPVRFDTISMMVFSDNRALLRHHINCLGSGTIASSTD